MINESRGVAEKNDSVSQQVNLAVKSPLTSNIKELEKLNDEKCVEHVLAKNTDIDNKVDKNEHKAEVDSYSNSNTNKRKRRNAIYPKSDEAYAAQEIGIAYNLETTTIIEEDSNKKLNETYSEKEDNLNDSIQYSSDDKEDVIIEASKNKKHKTE